MKLFGVNEGIVICTVASIGPQTTMALALADTGMHYIPYSDFYTLYLVVVSLVSGK